MDILEAVELCKLYDLRRLETGSLKFVQQDHIELQTPYSDIHSDSAFGRYLENRLGYGVRLEIRWNSTSFQVQT